MKKIAIKGSKIHEEQKEIIEILKSLGGRNKHRFAGNTYWAYYYINNDNIIDMTCNIDELKSYVLLTLEQYKEKYINKENNKELQIEIPEGYEIDQEKSTFEKIVFKKIEEKLTYEDIAKKLFSNNIYYYIEKRGNIGKTSNNKPSICDIELNNAPTEHQLQRLLALNKLMNVAYYLNDGWEPNWKDKSEGKYCIIFNGFICTVENNVWASHGGVVFKSMELAEQAIEILGDETIKLALSVI